MNNNILNRCVWFVGVASIILALRYEFGSDYDKCMKATYPNRIMWLLDRHNLKYDEHLYITSLGSLMISDFVCAFHDKYVYTYIPLVYQKVRDVEHGIWVDRCNELNYVYADVDCFVKNAINS